MNYLYMILSFGKLKIKYTLHDLTSINFKSINNSIIMNETCVLLTFFFVITLLKFFCLKLSRRNKIYIYVINNEGLLITPFDFGFFFDLLLYDRKKKQK